MNSCTSEIPAAGTRRKIAAKIPGTATCWWLLLLGGQRCPGKGRGCGDLSPCGPAGNVQQLASWVREETGGDLFAIRVTDPDPSDWDACLARANAERGDDARPELAENVEDLDRYGTVFLGYPNWWYGVPMALLTFLEQNGLSGKEVYLFCSHGTGGLARSVELITEAETAANISGNIFDFYEEASGPGWRTWGMVRAPQGTRRQEPGGSRRNLTAGLLSIGRMTEPPQTPLWCSSPSPRMRRTTAPMKRSSTRPSAGHHRYPAGRERRRLPGLLRPLGRRGDVL